MLASFISVPLGVVVGLELVGVLPCGWADCCLCAQHRTAHYNLSLDESLALVLLLAVLLRVPLVSMWVVLRVRLARLQPLLVLVLEKTWPLLAVLLARLPQMVGWH